MDSCNLSYTLGFEQQKRLSDLARRCRGINGWGVQELLQHTVTANYKADINLKPDFGEDKVARLEDQFCIQTTREHLCISDEEHANCQRIALHFGLPCAPCQHPFCPVSVTANFAVIAPKP